MARLLIVAHAPLATSLRAVAQHVYPDCGQRVEAIDVAPDEPASEVVTRTRAALAAEGDMLILTDVYGATPCNAALEASMGSASRVVAGVNVPMLWRALCYAEQPLDELVARAVAGGTQGVLQLGAPRRQNQPQPTDPHAAFPHQDQ